MNSNIQLVENSKLKAGSGFLWLIQLDICNYCIRKVQYPLFCVKTGIEYSTIKPLDEIL